MRPIALLLVMPLLFAGCGSDDSESSTSTTAATPTTSIPGPAAPAPVPSAACTEPPPGEPPAPGDQVDFVSGGADRYYLLSAPADTADPVPLILDLHGYLEGAAIHSVNSGLGPVALAEGVAVATPQGAGNPAQWGFTPETADIGFFDDLIDDIEATVCVDRSRIYATGLSNGAFMSSILACELPERIAAVAPVAGVRIFESCPIGEPTPLVAFHGTDDTFVSFDGGIGSSVGLLPNPDGSGGTVEDAIAEADTSYDDAIAEIDSTTVPETVADWAAQNGCSSEPVEERIGETIRHLAYDCPTGGATQLYIIEGGGHTWPGSEFMADGGDIVGETTFEIDANRIILDFFADQHLEEPPG